MLNKKGRFDVVQALDIVGFVIIIAGAGLIRYGNNEIISLLGGFIMAGGTTILGLTRMIGK